MPAVQFIGDVVRKSGDADAIVTEGEKARAAREIGLRTGLFYVPEVINLDGENGILDTERIHSATRLQDLALVRDPRLGELCFRAGKALAAIHGSLCLAKEMLHPLSLTPRGGLDRTVHSRTLEAYHPSVVLHGDFNGDNVMYDSANDRLVIIDWSSAPGFKPPFTIGPAYFDIAWFGFFFYRFQPMTAFGWQPKWWFRRLIEGYQETGGNFDNVAYGALKSQLDPILRDDYDLQCARKGRGMKRVPYLLRQSITWRMWQACNPARAEFWQQ
jgi:hypothetical protein